MTAKIKRDPPILKMPKQKLMPFFSVIIATRNRPTLFGEALESVLGQCWSDIEIIVVDDSSTAAQQRSYASILGAVASKRIHPFALTPTHKGHGQSFVLNFGAAKANAPYLCFLDDDDSWTDRNHLSRARAVISASSAPVDIYMANQAAFRHGERQLGPSWLEDLPGILAWLGNRPDHTGAHTVTVEELLRSVNGYCHLNTLIVRRSLFHAVGGMQEDVRWKCDHDLYFRLIDRAALMKYVPVTVARHNIPDPAEAESMTTTLSEVERRLFQLMVLKRAQCLCHHPAIRNHARRHRGYTLKRIAELLAIAGRHVEAAYYAREALRCAPTLKWAGYTIWRGLRALAQT